MVDVMEMMKKVQQMQSDMKKIAQELEGEIVSTGSGRGAVIASVSGNMALKALKIDPALAPMDDPQKLSELVIAAVNDGLEKAKALGAKKMGSLTGGLNIPGLDGLMGR